MDCLWQTVRERANLDGSDGGPRIRIKDLRAQFAIAAEGAGLPQTVIVHGMGHNDEAMTRRYQIRRAALTLDQADTVERTLGLGRDEPSEAGLSLGLSPRKRRSAQLHKKAALPHNERAAVGSPVKTLFEPKTSFEPLSWRGSTRCGINWAPS